MKRVFRYLIGSLFIARSLFADGTLPFGDGTLPFDMVGNVIETAPDGSSVTLPIRVTFESGSMGSSGGQLPGNPIAETVSCRPPLISYQALGEIIVDSSYIYEITGVCASNAETGQRIVEARRSSELLQLNGNLKPAPFGRGQIFEGEASIRNSNGVVTRRFRFELDL